MGRIITLTTDFGTQDGYVGIMKGVILGINPQATVVDITHEVAPQNLEQGAFLLPAAVPYFPAGTIHVIVVDPGVGTERRSIAVESGGVLFVAPDNGVLGQVLAGSPFNAVHLDRPEYWLSYVSSTFHGRDIFAPCAAHLSLGVPLGAMGTSVTDLVRFNLTAKQLDAPGAVGLPLRMPSAVIGRVIHVDRFGNCITNISQAMLTPLHYGGSTISLGGHTIGGIRRTYSDVAIGQPVALIGSSGYLEIAVRDGNAARQLGIQLGDQVTLIVGNIPGPLST